MGQTNVATLWSRIPIQSENILGYFPFLDPIRIMSLLAIKKKKKKPSPSILSHTILGL